jgi:CubicO group peptidase (beta-lactamase class C family)
MRHPHQCHPDRAGAFSSPNKHRRPKASPPGPASFVGNSKLEIRNPKQIPKGVNGWNDETLSLGRFPNFLSLLSFRICFGRIFGFPPPFCVQMRFSLKFVVVFFLSFTMAAAADLRDVSAALEPIRAKYKVPACASAVMEDGRLIAIGATGLRRSGDAIQVTTSDIWHIGSCTKSMTAALAGVLVDAGKLRWDMPIPEAFLGVPCHPAWRKVTLWDLVTQRSGLGAISRDSLDMRSARTPIEQRDRFARGILLHSPGEAPGKFDYSNAGYGLLGALLERASGESYEDLLRTRIFAPLELKTAGFGAPATPGKLDEPWGHWRHGDRLVPVDPTPENQFPPTRARPSGVRAHVARRFRPLRSMALEQSAADCEAGNIQAIANAARRQQLCGRPVAERAPGHRRRGRLSHRPSRRILRCLLLGPHDRMRERLQYRRRLLGMARRRDQRRRPQGFALSK